MGARIFIEGYELDTFGDIDVDFSFSISDISDIEKRNTSFSKTLTLPNTATNQKLFGSIFDISSNNDYYDIDPNVLVNFNPAKVASSQIYLDGVKIFDGILRLIKINNKNGDITYETNVFGKLNDILAAIGDSTLADLDWSDYNHTYDLSSITGSWSRTEWIDNGFNYVYPLVDYGVSLDGITYPLVNFRPTPFIREILKRIFKESGFRIIAPFFDTDFFKKLILIPSEKLLTKQVSVVLDAKMIGVEAFTNLSDETPVSTLIPFNAVTSDGFINQTGSGDLAGDYVSFKWNSATVLSVKSVLKYAANITFNTEGIYTVRFELKKLGVPIRSEQFSVNTYVSGDSHYFAIDWNTNFELNLNDIIYGEIIIYRNDILATIDCDIFFPIGSTFVVENIIPTTIEIGEGGTLDFKYSLPKSVKQRDFLKSIIIMFNLYVTPDKLQDKVLEFIPHTLFYSTVKNEALDWTYKVDKNQDISITPLSDVTAREYRIGYSDDTDYWSTYYKTKFNLSYGESRTILDNDFELDTKEIKVLFGSPVMRQEVDNRKMIHMYKVENNVKVRDNFKPRIASWLPNVTTSTWNISTATAGTHAYTSYPYAGHFDNPNSPTNDILFGTPREVFFSITSYPSSNLYAAFYDVLITSIGDKNSRLITGQFYLNPIDIMNLDFRQMIKFGNHYYELHKIEKYNPINNGTSSVHLFKILGQINPLIYENLANFLMNEDGTYLLQQNGIDRFYI